MERGYVYRAYPNVKQRELIKKTFGCKRFVYNYFLDVRKAHWENDKKNMTFFEMNKLLAPLKQEKDFLREPDKNALQNALRDLDTAHTNFFSTVHKTKGYKFGYPRKKSKRGNYQSYRTNFTNNNIAFEGTHIKLPKLGRVRIRGGENPRSRGQNPQRDRPHRTRRTVLYLDLRDRRSRACVGVLRSPRRYRPWYQRPRDPLRWHAV